jgi:hypothetical protein
MTPLRHPAPDRTTGAKLADTDFHAGKALTARPRAAGRNGTVTMAQPIAAIPDSKKMEITTPVGGPA